MFDIRENVALAALTTIGVGGPARYFAEARTQADAAAALAWARERQLPLFVLGGGSNLLVSDAGFHGLVLKVSIPGIESHDANGLRIYHAGAGEEWDTLVARAVADNCAGLECLSGIPGSVGGTPVQNVGAYGQEVAESIHQLEALEVATGAAVLLDRAACDFHYRRSRFNSADAGRFLITRVAFALAPGGAPKLAYADLKKHFAATLDSGAQPSLAAVREAVLAIRRAKGMVLDDADPESRSAGSFFKNPVVSRATYQRIAAASSVAVPHYEAGEGRVKLAAAWLIENAGLSKGWTLGPAGLSRKHTLAVVNRGGATAADVLRLKDYVQRRVWERFGVELAPEPVMLGF